ncbi:MAG TPA: glycosyltransferase [Pirellulales bacterium]|nr:glycosyltransferase [Pirellulales bacterium]
MTPDPATKKPAGRRIVLTALGSMGDLHPFMAIALGLKARGHEAIVASGECYRQQVEAAGLGFRPIRPDSNWLGDEQFMRHFSHPRMGLLRGSAAN